MQVTKYRNGTKDVSVKSLEEIAESIRNLEKKAQLIRSIEVVPILASADELEERLRSFIREKMEREVADE